MSRGILNVNVFKELVHLLKDEGLDIDECRVLVQLVAIHLGDVLGQSGVNEYQCLVDNKRFECAGKFLISIYLCLRVSPCFRRLSVM